MTHHSEPAREAVAQWPERLTLRDTKVVADEGQRIFTTATGYGYEKREYVRADLTSPAPAAGGLEAVRVTRKLLLEWSEDFDEASKKFERLEKCVLRTRAQECRDLAALASPAATSGRGAEVAAAIEACDWSAPSLGNSAILREAVSLLRSAPAATSAETQGGDGVREAAELLSHLKLYVLEKLGPDDADALHDRMGDLTAALAPSTSAATRGEPVAWSLIWNEQYGVNTETTFKTEEEAARYAGRCLTSAKPRVVALYDHPAPAVESAQVKVLSPPDGLGYSSAEHVGWDLRLIADATDDHAGYATANARILRNAASMLDGLAPKTSHNDALARARASLDLATDAEG